MKIIDFYEEAEHPLISFEIIPPKRGGTSKQVFDALEQIMHFRPPFIDVTSHAAEEYYEEFSGGMVRRHAKRKRPGTIGLCAAIKHRFGVEPVPHLLCKGFTKEETEDALIELNYLGIENVLAVRGDDKAASKPHLKDKQINEFAIDLVKQIKLMNQGVYLEELADASATDFCVGVAGYPEKHFEAPNLDWDLQRLKEKVDAGADYIVTQMFFDNDFFFDFVDRCRAIGIEVPIIPGIKILTRFAHLTRLPKNFFCNIPPELAEEVHSNPNRARAIGEEWCSKQCLDLLERGVPGLHFYIMSNPAPVIRVIESLPSWL